MDRRSFVQWVAAAALTPGDLLSERAGAAAPGSAAPVRAGASGRAYSLARIPNEYTLLLPGEAEALARVPAVSDFRADSVQVGAGAAARRLGVGDELDGWRLVALIPDLDGVATAVLEKHVTHRGVVAYLTEKGEVARIPKSIGELASIRPRPSAAPPEHRLERPVSFPAQPDRPGEYILGSDEDPCYENVAALGAEFIGWTLAGNEEAGPERSLWLEPDGRSRQFGRNPEALWAPDRAGRLFDPRRLLPSEYLFEHVAGYSKRTLLGGYLPVPDIGVWHPKFRQGYEVMVLLPPGAEASPMARVRATVPRIDSDLIPAGDTNAEQKLPDSAWVDRYWNSTPATFFTALYRSWTHWRAFHEKGLRVDIPDPWLLDAARAGITLARCSYRGLEPSYQVGEGAYTKMPERSHALFPVAHYEFVWAQQLWGLAHEVEPYFEHYLDRYVLPDGQFVYNTQDQVEAPLNAGVFLELSARAYDYTGDLAALQRRLPRLRGMIDFVERRYRYGLQRFPEGDRRRGLIWGSPEADLGDPKHDTPDDHPWYYQNAAWTWRGLYEHARVLQRAARDARARRDATAPALQREGAQARSLADEMRGHIERSLRATLSARHAAMKTAGIPPFEPMDVDRKPEDLNSYENHRFMMDWWTADWGDPELDEGHFRHRQIAGEQLLGMNTDGHYPRVSNFMEHGTLAGRIRQDDYRPFLLALYGNLCYCMDSGSRYAPEDALVPGNFPGEGSPYAWSAVVNSTLQPAMGLRWLLCWEEHDPVAASDATPAAAAARRAAAAGAAGAAPRDTGAQLALATVHLQKAAPKHWFAPGQSIVVERCPTRFGALSWRTEPAGSGWRVTVELPPRFGANLMVHIHPPDGRALRHASLGEVRRASVRIPARELIRRRRLALDVS